MKVALNWDSETGAWSGKRLTFTEKDEKTWTMTNEDGLEIGEIGKVRVGAWMHWCILLWKDCYLSPGCTDEAREMQRILGGTKR